MASKTLARKASGDMRQWGGHRDWGVVFGDVGAMLGWYEIG